MKHQSNEESHLSRFCTRARWMAAAVLLAAGVPSCAKVTERTEGETHFLTSCNTDNACPDSLECVCGICTVSCESDEVCRSLADERHQGSVACKGAAATAAEGQCSAEQVSLSVCGTKPLNAAVFEFGSCEPGTYDLKTDPGAECQTWLTCDEQANGLVESAESAEPARGCIANSTYLRFGAETNVRGLAAGASGGVIVLGNGALRNPAYSEPDNADSDVVDAGISDAAMPHLATDAGVSDAATPYLITDEGNLRLEAFVRAYGENGGPSNTTYFGEDSNYLADTSGNLYDAYNEGPTVTKRNALGGILWTIPWQANRQEYLSFATDQDGNTFASGGTYTGTLQDFDGGLPPDAKATLTKLSRSGQVLWQQSLDDVAPAFGTVVTTDAEGAVYWGVARGNETEVTRTSIHKYTSEGHAQWSNTVDGDVMVLNIVVDSHGSVYLGGILREPGQEGDDVTLLGLVIKIDNQGRESWRKVSSSEALAVWSIALDKVERLFVLDERIQLLDQEGVEVWSQALGFASSLASLAVGNDNYLYLGGASYFDWSGELFDDTVSARATVVRIPTPE